MNFIIQNICKRQIIIIKKHMRIKELKTVGQVGGGALVFEVSQNLIR